MSRAHSHQMASVPGRTGRDQIRRLLFALLLSALFLLIEVIMAFWTGSLALLADAAHMLTDVAALSLSAFATWVASKPTTLEKTYGYHRAEILAAVLNAVVLLLLSVWILYEAYARLVAPPEVLGLPMAVIGLVGLGVNALSLKLLVGGSNANLNVQSAYLEALSDAISSAGVLAAGVIVWLTGWNQADPLLSAGISVFILWRTWSLLTKAVNVLMEGVPSHLNAREIGQSMASTLGVSAVHDLHVWTITSGLEALSAHVVVPAGIDRDETLARLQALLRERFGIEHCTLQMVEAPSDSIQVSPDFKEP